LARICSVSRNSSSSVKNAVNASHVLGHHEDVVQPRRRDADQVLRRGGGFVIGSMLPIRSIRAELDEVPRRRLEPDRLAPARPSSRARSA
jgi:hypothetical protein